MSDINKFVSGRGIEASAFMQTMLDDTDSTTARTTISAMPASYVPKWSEIINKPTTLSGYGITDATPSSHVGSGAAAHAAVTTTVNGFMTAADKVKLDGIATSANNYVHPTSGVTAGTYTSVTVNTQGHVTGGTSPTTLAGYGITDAQPLDATLTALAGVATAADKVVYFTAADTATTATLTAFGRTLIDDVDAAAGRTTLGAQATLTGAATTIATSNLTVSKALVSDASGKVAVSTTSAVELGYVAGVTSGIQSQLNGKQASLGFTAENSANKNAANGYAGLDASGKLNSNQLPAIAISDTFVVASEVEMLALVAEIGDIAVRTDISTSFILKTADASVLANWQELLAPTATVTSVNGQTGVVNITTITGNAGTATKLATARTISLTGDITGSVAFDGSANVSIATAYKNSGVTAGTYHSVTVDAKGNITAGTNPTTLAGYGITDAIGTTDNAASASKLATARSITLTGDVTGTVNFDGSANVSITTAYKNSGVTAGTYRSVTVDAKGNITAATNPTTLAGYGITDAVSTTGNAASATKWATARTLTYTGGATGSGSVDGSANVSIAMTVPPTGHVHNLATISDSPYKEAADAATTAALTVTATATTLTNAGTMAALVLDGVTLAANQRVLVKNQATAGQNGIYVVTNIGSGTVNWVLTRASDADTSAKIAGAMVTVDSGTSNGAGLFTNDYVKSGTLGTTVMNWRAVVDTGNFSTLHPNSGATAGTYRSVTVNAQGHVTAGTNPTTLAGYGITDAVSSTGNAASATKLATARTITLTGDVTGSVSFDGSANVSIVTNNAASGVTAGTYKSVTVNADGHVTAGTNPTTLAGYGITDALGISATAAAASKWATARTISLTGDVTGSVSIDGSANVSIATTAKNSGVTAGTYRSVTVDAKGNVTGGSNPTTLGGYGITDALASSAYHPRADSLNNSGGTIAIFVGDLNALGAGQPVLAQKSGSSNYPATSGYSYVETKSIYSNALLQTCWPYDGQGEVYHRNYSVNTSSWSSWRRVSDNTSATVCGNATGNDYYTTSFQAYGNGSANTVYPGYGFHQPAMFAGSLQMRDANTFYFYKQGAGAYADVVGNIGNYADVYIRSDKRLKSNFELIGNALSKVHALTGYTYDKKESLDSTETVREAGLIADSVVEQLPEACRELGEDRLKTISPSALTALLVEAVKETDRKAEAKIAELTASNEQLSERLSRMEALLGELMNNK